MDDTELRSHLANIFEQIKEFRSEMSSIANQLASLRDILKENSPNFSRLFEERLIYWQSQGASFAADEAATFDAVIQRLKQC